MKKEKFICNGRIFDSYESVELYAVSIGYRISNTETIRKNTVLITIQKVN